jgi:DNA-binding response OmpR family regulator
MWLYDINGFGKVSSIRISLSCQIGSKADRNIPSNKGETLLKLHLRQPEGWPSIRPHFPVGRGDESAEFANTREGSVRVLVIEDDTEMAEAIGIGLRRADIAVDVVFEGRAGLGQALANDYDVIVLDRDLPGVHGDEICAALVDASCRSRILMLTAAAGIVDLVDGLGRGADDYLSKPFDFPVLIARIGALYRRAQPALAPILRHGTLELDTAQRQASRDGRTLELSPKEFGVLELLLASRGRAVSAEELLERVWDDAADPFTTAVKITVSRLRAKLGNPPLIVTVLKSGYRI